MNISSILHKSFVLAVSLNMMFTGGCALLGLENDSSTDVVQDELSLQEMFIQGKALKDQGRMTEARDMYLELVRLYPNLPEAHNNLAVVYLELEEYANAERALNEAMRIYPQYAAAQRNLDRIDEYRRLAQQKQEQIQQRFLAEQKSLQLYCYAVQDVNEEEGKRLVSLLQSNQMRASYTEEEHVDNYYVVYLDTGHSGEVAQKYISGLRDKGYTDYMHIRTGSLIDQVSLGVFYSPARAERHIDNLAYLGHEPRVREYGKTKRTIRINFAHDVSTEFKSELKDELSQYSIIGQDCGQLI